MTSQSAFVLRGRNPDILTCIANLSNDEVFTPPELANQMLDTLARAWAANNNGANIWADKTVTFLDPCTKSGVFLREITSRLTEGLKDAIPDLQKRVDHILTKQVFGIGITQITSLLARRSVYCSKFANGEHSIAESFTDEAGNIWFKRTKHTWEGNKCKFCSAPKVILDRSEGVENYAYPFIHTDDIKTWTAEKFGGDMKFDVVIGNPPYQMKGGSGGTNDSPIYHLFVEHAKRLEPKFLSMIVPSRWLAGGRGLDEFRKEMLGSHELVSLVDYPVSSEVFPGVEVKGGVCYFLWEPNHDGPCEVTVVRGNERQTSIRQLNQFDVFVRDPRAVEILQKVLRATEVSITEILTADTPFGLATNFDGFHAKEGEKYIALHYVRSGKRSVGFVRRDLITKNSELITKWKVLVPKAGSDGGQNIPDSVLGKPLLSSPPSVCTQSFLAFTVGSKSEAESLESYYRSKLFRFLVSLRKLTQHALRSTYTWVPQQTWDREWTDRVLYKKYKLTKEEIEYIESMIRPMEVDDE
jgi:site-specific DNA-methyltransferase (adenine-specific)